MNPSPWIFCSDMPKSLQRWVTSLSVSSNVPSSSRNSTRSRADILPSLCCRSRRLAPPPSSASWFRFFSSATFCSKSMGGNYSGWEGAAHVTDIRGGPRAVLKRRNYGLNKVHEEKTHTLHLGLP